MAAISWPELTTPSSTALGTVLIIVAITLYGLAANLAVPLQQRYGALPVLLRAQLAALVVVMPFGLAQVPGSEWSTGPVLAMVPLGVLSTGLAFVMMANLVGRVGGTRGSVPIYLIPVVEIVLEWSFATNRWLRSHCSERPWSSRVPGSPRGRSARARTAPLRLD